MSQLPVVVGTPSVKADLDTNFTNIQANFVELYRGSVIAPAITGTPATDTAAINAALLNGNAHVLITADVTINAPLVIYSNTHLELAPGVTVTYPATTGPMLSSRSAFNPQRTISDAAIISGTTTLNSATAAFTSADVGRSVIVTDAGAGGKYSVSPFTVVGGPLCADIVSVTSATEVELAYPAQATVTAATVNIYDRDENIKLSGGKYVFTGVSNPENGITRGIGNTRMMLFFRRVNGLVIDNVELDSTKWAKYAINLGDVRHARISNIVFDSAADGLHIRGPAVDIKAVNLSGYTEDDFTAITAADNIVYTDVQGDVVDVIFENIHGSTGENHFKITATAGTEARGVVARNYTDATGETLKATIYDDPLCGTGAGTTVKGLLIENWAGEDVGINLSPTGDGNNVIVRNIERRRQKTISETSWADVFYFGSGSKWDEVTIDGFRDLTKSYRLNGLMVAGTINKLTVLNANVTSLSTANDSRLLSHYGSITTLVLSNITQKYGGIVNQRAGSTITRAMLSNIVDDSTARMWDISSPANIIINNLYRVNIASPAFYVGTNGTLILSGNGYNGSRASSMVQRAASESITVNCLEFPCNLSQVTHSANSMCHNSSSALACGAGPVISNGTIWKHMYTGATY